MNAYDMKKMALAICSEEIANRDELCRLDSFVGDGDHGFTVERGFSAAKKELENLEPQTPGQVLAVMSSTLEESMGGAIGLIVGSLFSGGAKALGEASDAGVKEFGDFLENGLAEIKEVGGAKEGDRTLIDALSPAVAAYRKLQADGAELAVCLQAAAVAAADGATNTANMTAKKGRARFLQEKSLGYVDAGAVTMEIIIKTMSAQAAL